MGSAAATLAAPSVTPLARDPLLPLLDAREVPFAPLGTLGWNARERPHTRFLAWVLDPAPSSLDRAHTFGVAPLEALARTACAKITTLPGGVFSAPLAFAGSIDPRSVRIDCERPVGDGLHESARAPDIRCAFTDGRGRPWLLIVENKLDAPEGDGQVTDYVTWARRAFPEVICVVVYVTPDGRGPAETGAPTAALRWGEVAGALLPTVRGGTPASDFATTVLLSLRARFGGDPEALTLVEELHSAHPRECAKASSLATDPGEMDWLRERFPRAAWHLKSIGTVALRMTREWSESVARRFSDEGLRVTATAPHVGIPDEGCWCVEGVSEVFGVCLRATTHGARTRLGMALYAPRGRGSEVFAERGHEGLIAELTDAELRGELMAAAVSEPDAWGWRAVGRSMVAPRGISEADQIERVAEALRDAFGSRLLGLKSAAQGVGDAGLYSCDLDGDRVIPHDRRDRAVLAERAGTTAERVWVVARSPTGHPAELREAAKWGALISDALGAGKGVTYDFSPAGSMGLVARPTVVLVPQRVFEGDRDPSWEAADEAVRTAVKAGATVLRGEDLGEIDDLRGRPEVLSRRWCEMLRATRDERFVR